MFFRTNQHDVSPETPDYEKFRPYFGWVDTVQKTMEQSTQWEVSIPNTFPMKKHLKSRNPALNIPRRHAPVATDTVFSDTPAVDSVRELDLAMCVSPSSNGSKMRSLWTNQMKS